MQIRISSALTFFHKIIYPIFLLFTALLAASIFLTKKTNIQPIDYPTLIIVATIFIIVSLYITRDFFQLKSVYIDEHNIIVKNFTKNISIPIENIVNVGEIQLWPGFEKKIYLKLNIKSDFGSVIKFIPKEIFQFSFQGLSVEHPITKKLRLLINTKSEFFNN